MATGEGDTILLKQSFKADAAVFIRGRNNRMGLVLLCLISIMACLGMRHWITRGEALRLSILHICVLHARCCNSNT
jgi:hypothetical protein